MRDRGAGAGRVAVVGAGRMGVPLGLALALAGYTVDVVDVRERDEAGHEALRRRTSARVEEELRLLQEEQVLDGAGAAAVRSRLHLRRGYGPYLGEAEAVFEALPERLDVKEPHFRVIGELADPGALVASTTSTLHPDTLAAFLQRAPERFMVTHWLNPPVYMPLVEVVPGASTAAAHRERMLALLRRAGKEPVVCAPSAGFIVPRLQALLMNEAARMAGEGVAGPAELDRATRLGLGFRFLVVGLLEFADFGGIDTLYYASSHLARQLGDKRFEPPPEVRLRMERGEHGASTGRGFYDWTSENMRDFEPMRKRAYIRLLRHLGLLAAPGPRCPDAGSPCTGPATAPPSPGDR